VEPSSNDPRTAERCAEARRLQQIENAYLIGDLDAFPADEPPDLVTAIYLSPLPLIRRLLSLGVVDPNKSTTDDGFPPLIATLSCAVDAPGARQRKDVHAVLRLLLRSGADPNLQRGINDYTPLHMAVEVGDPLAVLFLLDAGADAEARTRIDHCETAREMAWRTGQTAIVTILDNHATKSRGTRLRPGLFLIADIPGSGDAVRCQHRYLARIRIRCADREARIPRTIEVEDDGDAPLSDIFIHRGRLINGVFYGVDGMRVGGTRRLYIAPHLAYGSEGLPGRIPPNAGLIADITIVREVASTLAPHVRGG
jgi:uncharacterized protein